MSNYRPANYNFSAELIQAEIDGYHAARIAHSSGAINGVDRDGNEIGYSLGYKQGSNDNHNPSYGVTDATGVLTGFTAGYDTASLINRDPSTVNSNDQTGNPTGYNAGYEAASAYHHTSLVSGTDSKGRERGYYRGYKDARDYHTSVSSGGTDATGTQRGYTKGANDYSVYHTTPSTGGTDAFGRVRGYAQGYNDAARGLIMMNNTQDLPVNVYTRINMNRTMFLWSMDRYASYNLRTLKTGYHDIFANVSMAIVDSGSGNTFGHIYVGITKNGSYLGYARTDVVAYSDDRSCVAAHFPNVYCNGGDYFSVYVKPVFDGARVNHCYAYPTPYSSDRQGSFLAAYKR